jgi:hypothetical protein
MPVDYRKEKIRVTIQETTEEADGTVTWQDSW